MVLVWGLVMAVIVVIVRVLTKSSAILRVNDPPGTSFRAGVTTSTWSGTRPALYETTGCTRWRLGAQSTRFTT